MSNNTKDLTQLDYESADEALNEAQWDLFSKNLEQVGEEMHQMLNSNGYLN